MRNWLFVLFLLSIACYGTACSTKNEGAIGALDRAGSRAFSVETEPGTGMFTPELAVSETSTGTSVTITAQDAQGLVAAFLHLRYDAASYTPQQVDFSTFLGTTEEVLSLAITEQAGDVPLGLVQIPSTGVLPRTGNGILAVVHFKHTPFTSVRQVSGAPAGTRNEVDDLAITAQSTTSATLHWTEKNVGDYNNNGTVGITDLTPLAILFGQEIASASDPVWAALIDGNADGKLSIADLTPIGQNFGDRCDGYLVYVDPLSSELYDGSGIHAIRPNFASINPKQPVAYDFTATFANGATPEFSVRPVLGTDLLHPGPDSNHVNLIVDVPGAPDAPGNLVAEAGQPVGDQTVHLTWTLSPSADVVSYDIFRKPTSGSTWDKIAQASSLDTSYFDIDPTLTATSYDYRMLARDVIDQTSGWSNTASATPYLPPTLEPPINVSAIPSSGVPLGIDVVWDKPANDYGTGFRVYCKAPGQGSFSAISPVIDFAANPLKYTHEGLTEGQTYEYYVITLNGADESAQSAVASAQPSTSVLPISIESIATNKTTHHSSGSEDPAQLTVVTAPDTQDTVTWSGPGEFSSTSTLNPTWKPNGSTPKGKVTLTVNVVLGGNSDTATIDMYVTGESIKKNFQGRDGTNRQVGDPPGSGIMPDVSLTVTQYLEPLFDGGEITAGTGMLSDYMEGRPILFDEWELWCGPCRAEFPDLDDYAEQYLDYGFRFIAGSSDMSAGNQLPDIKSWFMGNAIDYCHDFHGNIYSATWAKLGADGYIPFNVLIDRDGMVRKVGGQANGADWAAAIKELCGAP